MSISLNSITFPKFNPTQLEFFKEMIQLTQQDRLALDPGATSYEIYKLQYTSLKSMEDTYAWLLAANGAQLQAERAERIEGKEFDPQGELEDSSSELEADLSNLHSLI